ncbi:hypothetical protein ACFVSN_29100 [Kitasatospora sp. NPDC057904]|uniref:hypothetical protein n=1 Tax=Kitasatospora sp. NPDC057904 TaxID=3346275 RepID=UPI0036DA5C73
MTRQELAALLTDQTPACGPARRALLSGGAFDVGTNLIPARRLAGVYSRRERRILERGLYSLGLAESLAILRQAGDGALRVAVVQTPDCSGPFIVFLDATAPRVLACLDSPRFLPRPLDTHRPSRSAGSYWSEQATTAAPPPGKRQQAAPEGETLETKHDQEQHWVRHDEPVTRLCGHSPGDLRRQ